jgi:hypothetical protein
MNRSNKSNEEVYLLVYPNPTCPLTKMVGGWLRLHFSIDKVLDGNGGMVSQHNDWMQAGVIAWCELLMHSFRHWTGTQLVAPDGGPEEQARRLFEAPFVFVSHGNEPDPVLNYGNRAALLLWELTWDELRRTPSHRTAEAGSRAERAGMLARAEAHGYIADYRGVRISRSGRRFLVENALVWNVMKGDLRVGQAATFSRWTYLDWVDSESQTR